MAMLGNFSNRIYGAGGNTGSNIATNFGARTSWPMWYGFIWQEGASSALDTAAYPTGGYAPSAYYKPIKIGEMSLHSTGAGAFAGDLVPSRSMIADFTGSGDLAAIAALAVAMQAAFSGSGTLTASIVGNLEMAVDMTGAGDLDATIGALGNMAADLFGTGDLDAIIAAYGNMEIDIVVTGTGLSTANVGQAVWAAMAAANNTSGTMGEKLNDAGAAGNPWAALLASNNDPDTFGRLLQQYLNAEITSRLAATASAPIDDIQAKTDELHKLQGLASGSPMTVTTTSRTVDDITLQITGDGATTTTVTRT